MVNIRIARPRKIKKGKELTASIEASAEAARNIVPSLGDNQREAEMPRRP